MFIYVSEIYNLCLNTMVYLYSHIFRMFGGVNYLEFIYFLLWEKVLWKGFPWVGVN